MALKADGPASRLARSRDLSSREELIFVFIFVSIIVGGEVGGLAHNNGDAQNVGILEIGDGKQARVRGKISHTPPQP
jgi:hypothetical protein